MVRRGFSLVEILMASALVAYMFIALDGILVMTVRRGLASSYTENAQLMCQRAALEINGYVANASTVVLLDAGGNVTTNPANTLVAINSAGNTNARFDYVNTNSTPTGSLLITPYLGTNALPAFDYSDQITVPTGAAFSWTNSGFISYNFTLNLVSSPVPFIGIGKPNP